MKIKFNINGLIGKRGVALALALVSATTLAGCEKKADCDIGSSHLHKYVNTEGYIRYIDKEYLKYEGYEWTSDYIEATKEDIKTRELMDKKDLLRIDENLETIKNIQQANSDFLEYRYSYIFLQSIPHIFSNGKMTFTTFTYVPVTHYSWTNDSEHSNLTGEKRLCHYMYRAYKIEIDEKGREVLIPSEYVDDITKVMDEYPYIKKDYYKIFNAELDCEVDYEDGPEEELSDEEREKRESNIDSSYNNSSSYDNEMKLTLTK